MKENRKISEARTACDEALGGLGLLGVDSIRTANPLRSVLPEGAAGGECPFCRGERFAIHPDGHLFACPDCDERGDVIRAFQLLEDVDFGTAVRLLAEGAGSRA